MTEQSLLRVLLHDKEIGTLLQCGDDSFQFTFNGDYIANEQRPTLSLSCKDASGELITDQRALQTYAGPFFTNLLPQGRLKGFLATRAGVDSGGDFQLLQAFGEDLPGAIRILSADSQALPSHGKGAGNSEGRDVPSQCSAISEQFQFSAFMGAYGGLTIPPFGTRGQWTVKLLSSRCAGQITTEFALMEFARRVGIDVAEMHLLELTNIVGVPLGLNDLQANALAVKRCDRVDDLSIHLENFAQVVGAYPNKQYKQASYGHIANAIWIELGEVALREFVQRLVFNIMIGNAGLDLTQWLLVYPDKIRPQLARARGFISTVAFQPNDNMALKFGRTCRWVEVDKTELDWFSGHAQLPHRLVCDTARETIQGFLELWRSEKDQLGLNGKVAERIDSHIKRIPLVSELA